MSKLIIILLLMTFNAKAQNFRDEQKKFQRVKNAYAEKSETLKSLFEKTSLNTDQLEIFIRVFKEEGELEVWGKNKADKQFRLIKTYAICASSGNPGPKRKEGDGQVPEGFYKIMVFNPLSSFHLSMMIDYPNASDKILSDRQRPGDNICIHGNCVTIGCVPITDDKIKEVYLLAVEAKNAGQKNIPVHLFPNRMTQANFNRLCSEYKEDTVLINFWTNLKTGYDYFENNRWLPDIEAGKNGEYIIK